MSDINNIAWFLKYQPKKIEEYVFTTDQQKDEVKNWISNLTIPGNLLLFGPAGCGKTSLAELLIKSIVKKSSNVKKITSRSVSEIDQLYIWVQRKPAKPDNKKIIYIEEFDKLSIVAMNQLKDTLLEKFQEHVSFIVCTNYVNKIPNPVLTRFTYKYQLTSLNKDGTFNRIKEIIEAESLQYTDDDLTEFVSKNHKLGLRNIINSIQVNVMGDNIDFKKLSVSREDDSIESKVSDLAQSIFKKTLKADSIEKRTIYRQPMNSTICKEYTKLVEIIQFNHNIRWEEIYNNLYEKNTFLPLIQTIEKYINSFEMKKIQHIHFMSFISEGIEIMIKINL